MPKRIIQNHHFLPGCDDSIEKVDLLEQLYPFNVEKPVSDLQYGYLWKNEDFDKLIDTDTELLSELWLTHEQLAKNIEDIFACDNLEEFKWIPIVCHRNIATPTCPWWWYRTTWFEMSFKITEVVVLNKEKANQALALLNDKGKFSLDLYPELVSQDLGMIFSDLHPHLIRDHKFLQWHNTPYRVDPKRAIKYLNI